MEFFHNLLVRIVQCLSEYIFFVPTKKSQTHTYKQKPKKKSRMKMLLMLTISVENLTGYDDIT